ncbi:MAG TPA: PAS domain-containing protein, partial [Bryobacteraceae bacterium]|nr:PAS domain-containing protein [Bryobacteraceae bacterium]
AEADPIYFRTLVSESKPSFNLNLAWMQSRRLRPALIAIGAVACSAILRELLDPIAQDDAPLMLFCFSVILAALYGGFKSGIAAILLSIPTADFLFVDPRYTFFVHDPRGMLVMLATFGTVGFGICWVTERLNRTRAELRRLAIEVQNANSELRASQASLMRSDERFRMATAVANEAIWEWNPRNGTGAWSEPFVQKFGEPPQSGAFDWWLEKIHPDDRQRVSEGFLAALNSDAKEWKAEYRFRKADGEWAQMLDRACFARAADGKAVRVVGSNLDITEAARARAAVQESELRLNTLAAMVPEILFTATAQGEIDYASKRFTDFTGASPAALAGGGWLEFVHPEDRDRARQVWMDAIVSGRECGDSYRLRGADGQYRWFQCHAAPLRSADQKPVKWFGVCADIDDHIRLENEQRRQKEELVKANDRLHRFAFAVAHDLNEPLRTVRALTQMMRSRLEGALDDDTKLLMGSILGGAGRMRNLIHDLLEYSRIGEASAEPKVEIDLNEALAKALNNLQFAITESGAQIGFDRLPAIFSPPGLAASVFQNLLANALKYCDGRPEIYIGCRRSGGEWVISVKDNGIGIDPQYHSTIFEPFRRLHARSQYSGTGIGLASCKIIVEDLGGRIWVESAKGAGSTFFFAIPAAQSQTGSALLQETGAQSEA